MSAVVKNTSPVADAEAALAAEHGALADARRARAGADADLAEARSALAADPSDARAEAVAAALAVAAARAELVGAREQRVAAAESRARDARRAAAQRELGDLDDACAQRVRDLVHPLRRLRRLREQVGEVVADVAAQVAEYAADAERAEGLAASLGVPNPVEGLALEAVRDAFTLGLATEDLDLGPLEPSVWLAPLASPVVVAEPAEIERFELADALLAEIEGAADG